MISLDPHCVRVGNRVIAASQAERVLLHLLISRRNVPLTKDFIMSRLFGNEHGRDLRQVDMFVARLRRALEAAGLVGLISTIEGRGYAVLDDQNDANTVFHSIPHERNAMALAG